MRVLPHTRSAPCRRWQSQGGVHSSPTRTDLIIPCLNMMKSPVAAPWCKKAEAMSSEEAVIYARLR